MEKQKLFTNKGIGIPQPWNSIFGMVIQSSEVNCVNSMNQRDLFESALSSIVSSPANSYPGIQIPGAGESIVLKGLIDRIGSICNSSEISTQSCINGNNSSTNSCYNTPLNSPPKLNMPITDHQVHHGYSPIPGNQQSFKIAGSQFIKIPEENKKLGDSMEESSVSETGIKGHCMNTNGRKRKGLQKGKGKETQSSNTTIYDKVVAEVEKDESDAKKSKSNEKSTEPPKDYIHVRARRGQATDSHSLAERVRREKISERMKFLQGLVPGCNKITGKAVMLDEIINYVKSLQQQVEFLSMKLATVNPKMDASMETLLSKDVFQPQASLPNNVNPYNTSVQAFSFRFHSQKTELVPDGLETRFSMNPLMRTVNHSSMIKPSHIGGFSEASTLWENDLQSVVEMALGHDEAQGLLGQMEVEL